MPKADVWFYRWAAIPCELRQGRPLVVRELRAAAEYKTSVCLPNERLGDGLDFQPVFPEKNLWLALLVTTFSHGSLLHLLGNMYFLFVVGNDVEDRLGHARFLVLYLLAGAGALGLHTAVNPSATIPAVGASGAVAGVIGAYLVFFPYSRMLTLWTLPLPLLMYLPAFVSLGFWFVVQFTPLVGAFVAKYAHIGGFVVGAIGGPLLGLTVLEGKPRKAPKAPVYLNPPRYAPSRARI